MIGGGGDDTYYVAQAGDIVDESSEFANGTDTVRSSIAFSLADAVHVLGSVENLTLTGSANIDATGNSLGNTIFGNSGDNTLTGNDGDDALNGNGGSDTMIGGSGDDTYYIAQAGDIVDESSGNGTDTVISSITFSLADGAHVLGNVERLTLTGSANIAGTGNGLANAISGNIGDNTLTGNDGSDTLTGNAGNDTLVGGNDNDHLSGGNESDRLTGGSGADVQTGGLGADTFVLQAIADSTVSNTGRDYISDFSQAQGDIIDLSAIDANTSAAGDQAFNFIGALAFSGAAGELRSVVSLGDRRLVYGDINGDAVADFAILVRSVTPLQASDFTL